MPGVVKYPSANLLAQYAYSADPIYGTGMDGDATLNGSSTVLGMVPVSSVYTMTRDMYFNNLVVSANVRLDPGGYRVFVKNTLTLNSGSIVGYVTGFSTAGSIAQGGDVATAVTNSLGGASATLGVTAPLAAVGGSQWYDVPHQAVRGWSVSATNTTPTFLRGGAGGLLQKGGGVVIVAARIVVPPSSGTATFSAKATSPGGGGVVIIISSAAALPSGVATDVTGFAPGTAKYLQVA